MALSGALVSGGPLSGGAAPRAATIRSGSAPRSSELDALQAHYQASARPAPGSNPTINYAEDTLGGPPPDFLTQMLLGQLGQIQSTYGVQSGFLNQIHGLDASRLGLSGQGLGLDQQQLGLTQADIAAQLGFLGQREGLADRMLGNTQAGLSIEEAMAQAGAATNQRDINNRAAAGGAWFSPETRLDRSDTETSLAQRLDQIKLARESAGMGREGQQIDFDSARQGLMSDQASTGIDAARLDLAANSLGIDRSELDARLNNSLTMLGIGVGEQALPLLLQLIGAGGEQGAFAQQVLDYAYGLVMSGQSVPGGGTGASSPGMASGGGGSSAPKYM